MRIRAMAVLAAMFLVGAIVPAAAETGGTLAVPAIAVMPFEDAVIRADYHFRYGRQRFGPGAGVADIITGELVEEAERLGTFRVVERERLFEVLAEQDLGRDGRVDPATAAEVGRILGADLLLMGAVGRFDVRSDHIGLPRRIGFDAERHHATVSFEGRLTDTTTAEVVARGTGSGSDTAYGARITRGDLRGLDIGSTRFTDSLLGRAARSAARSVAHEIASQMDDMMAGRLDHLAEADGLVVYCRERGDQWWPMINRGARDGVREGDVVLIRRKLDDVYDPLTGELLHTVWADLGTMTVHEVDEKVAAGPLERNPDGPGKPRVGDIVILVDRN